MANNKIWGWDVRKTGPHQTCVTQLEATTSTQIYGQPETYLPSSPVSPSPVFPPWLQLIENSVCLLRNLSYQVHREIPGCERYQEALPLNQGPAPSSQKAGCFSSRKSKGWCQRERERDMTVFFPPSVCSFVTVHSSVTAD